MFRVVLIPAFGGSEAGRGASRAMSDRCGAPRGR